MSPSLPINCTHDRGPGTTVCLRCRHDHWRASQRRRQKTLMQFLALGTLGGLLGVAGVSAASTLRDRHEGLTQTSAGSIAPAAKRRATGKVVKKVEPAIVQASVAAPEVPRAAKHGF